MTQYSAYIVECAWADGKRAIFPSLNTPGPIHPVDLSYKMSYKMSLCRLQEVDVKWNLLCKLLVFLLSWLSIAKGSGCKFNIAVFKHSLVDACMWGWGGGKWPCIKSGFKNNGVKSGHGRFKDLLSQVKSQRHLSRLESSHWYF